jgi:hypothetical protein
MRSAGEERPHLSAMQRWRLACAIAALVSLIAPHADPAEPASDAVVTEAFEAQIAQLDALDSQAPQALETHLRYADYLVKQPTDHCGARLSAAQSQLQAAQQNIALGVVQPQGLARAADVEYQIHTALAACGDFSDPSHHDEELHAALAAAQRAAALYQDTFDYPAMLTMQFNAAVTYQALRDTAAAQSALKAVIDGDREYGFRDDAEENYAVLLNWSHADQTTTPDRTPLADQVAALMQDFPQRSTTLRFAWVAGDNGINLKNQSVRVIGNTVVHAEGDRTLTRRLRRRTFGWVVTYESLGSHYSLEPLPAGSGLEVSFMTSLTGMLLQFHDYTLGDTRARTAGKTADFIETINRDSFRARAKHEASSLLGNLPPTGAVPNPLGPVLHTELNDLLLPVVTDTAAALDYNLETGAWPGATLDQGQWYGMQIAMPLPFAPLAYVIHQVQFAFTRELPCSRDSDRTCVELVLRAIPDETDLENILRRLQQLHLKHGEKLHSWSTMYMRLITDPATLQAYRRDMRQFFYVSLDGAAKGALLGADESIIDRSPAVSDASAR